MPDARLDFAVVEKPLGAWTRFWNIGAVRKAFLLLVLAGLWEGCARWLNNPLLFPTFVDTVKAFFSAIASGELPKAASYTIQLLLKGYVAGLAIAALLTAFPSIALLPLALIWFGLGDGSIIFVLIHAVLWAVALNTYSGFRAVSPTLRMVGQNYGLSKVGYVTRILIPGAFPSILTGLKVGWAFAWRTLIAAELVFGVSSGSGGLGWYIFEQKNQLLIPNVFAGLLTVILFGLVVENLIFRTIENRTVRRWGMQV
jgi:NitT/TauT family transport system permease protein